MASFASSYIKTEAAAVTRNADNASVLTSAISGFSASTLTIFAEATQNIAVGDRAIAALNDGSTAERLDLRTNGLLVSDGNVEQAYIAYTNIAVTPTRIAAAAALNDFAISRDGAAVLTDVSGTMPLPTTLRIGNLDVNTNFLNGHLRKLALYNTRLSNAELVALSTL